MKLHTAKASPFGRTVEIVAHELGLHEDIEIVATKVVPADPNRSFQALTPLRKVPALELEDGQIIVDSTVIAEYLAARVGDHRLFARDSAERWTVLTRYVTARGISECAVAARYEIAVRPEEFRWPAWSDDQMDKISAALALFDTAPPSPSGRLTIADISLGAALGYLDFRFPDWGWRSRYPQLVAWLEPLNARPSFAATRPA